ncbi:MAG: hypothetical protein LBT16_08900, partial [Treponema sp.]|jgi:hypothetical protein|nr:hypothetical protein [Treponema sp.]
MYADIDPIQVGTVKIGLISSFGIEIKQSEVPVIFNPRTGYAYLDFFQDLTTYHQYWDGPGRQALINAIERYKTDYEARNLNLGRAKARRVYGTIEGFADWGNIKSMLNNRGYPKINLGYTFHKDSPYFTITQQETKNTKVPDGANAGSSGYVVIYFTRSMAEDLAALFNQDYLMSQLPAYARPSSASGTEDAPLPPVNGIQPDVY